MMDDHYSYYIITTTPLYLSMDDAQCTKNEKNNKIVYEWLCNYIYSQNHSCLKFFLHYMAQPPLRLLGEKEIQ